MRPHAPDEPPAGAAFRREVGEFRAAERRRTFPLGLHVGAPDGSRQGLSVPWPVPPEYDAGLRFDLADALVDQLLRDVPATEAAWAWLTRPGVTEVHDCDHGWLSATMRAFGAHELVLHGFRVVTRNGWLDLLSGDRRTWKRLRL